MVIRRIEVEPGVEPYKWTVVKLADIGADEPFVKGIDELLPIVDAGTIYEPQRKQVKEAITSILVDGLMPAFLELREIRDSVGKDIPLMNRMQPYEDLGRKLWRSYKELMQKAIKLMGFDIGFLFARTDKAFQDGMKKFRAANPRLRDGYEVFLEGNRKGWQHELSKFRNDWIEHPHEDPGKFAGFYHPKAAEDLFDCTWRAVADILPPLLELRLMDGVTLVEQHPGDPNPRWPQRFRYHHPSFANLK